LSLTRAEPLGFFTISSITPDTFDLAVVNCEPTVRVVIYCFFLLDLLSTFVDSSILPATTDIINPFRAFIYNDFWGKLLYFLIDIGIKICSGH
jgi:hypothetical protein